MREQTRVTVFDKEQYDGEWPPSDAAKFVEWFSEKLETIPSEYRTTSKIKIDSIGGYEGDSYARIEIYYDRPETDDEMACREAKEHRRKAEQEAYEIRTLAALKAKYE